MTKKLIEVSLPLREINEQSAREKTIRQGHPSTFHLWWARRPLAACRAVLFSSLVDDPSAHPELFPTEEAQEAERDRLFGIIRRLVPWEALKDATVLSEATREIKRSCGPDVPAVLDPFCGGGSVPLEAQRLGLEVMASDLNPVAVLVTKALVEIPARFAGRSPVRPGQMGGSWHGARGLAEDVRYYARWMNDEAERRVGHNYPPASLPGGGPAQVIAWLWARTVTCPNPACGVSMPLLNSFTVSARKGNEHWLEPQLDREAKVVRFRVRSGRGDPKTGTVTRTGAVCLACGSTVPLAVVREKAKGGGMGTQLLCTVVDGGRKRVYVEATPDQVAASQVARPKDVPQTELPYNPRAITTSNYGITRHWQLFTDRQLATMTAFCDLVAEAREKLLADGAEPAYADAVTTYLALCVSRLANRCSSQSFWNPNRDTVEQVFARNALPMIWVFAEANPFSTSTGNFLGQVEYLANALEDLPARGQATVRQLDAAAPATWQGPALVCTDPPYYDNVPYADLSDFFYVWLRRCLSSIEPDLFSTLLVPKAQELIAEPARQGSWEAAAAFFESGLRKAFENTLAVHDERFPLTLFYAFKQSEDTGDGSGHASTGWETMLQGLLDAGATITGTWPVRTEQPGGLREAGRAALASSIVLVCRRRDASAPLATRRELLAALKAEMPGSLRVLQHANIAPVDLAQASIGPGMAVFSRYARIVEADGSKMSVRAALGLINQVLDEVLAEQEGDLDPETRWAVAWFEDVGTDWGPFGKAETLSKAKNTAANALVRAGIVEQKGNKVRLLPRGELEETWDPVADTRLTVWEVTQHMLRALETGGEPRAAEILRRVGALGEAARELAYRLYVICERKKWAKDALAYNGLVLAWPSLIASASRSPVPEQVQGTLV
jgi:putative DNA methylase